MLSFSGLTVVANANWEPESFRVPLVADRCPSAQVVPWVAGRFDPAEAVGWRRDTVECRSVPNPPFTVCQSAMGPWRTVIIHGDGARRPEGR
jgi:hypothetical protein